jgi:hypothetical protein
MKTALMMEVQVNGFYWNYWTVTTYEKSNYFRERILNKASKVDTTHYRFHSKTYKDLLLEMIFCTIGTTIKKKRGVKVQKVDFEYPRQFCSFAIQNKVKQFLIISSLDDANLEIFI